MEDSSKCLSNDHRVMLPLFVAIFLAIGSVLAGAISVFHGVETAGFLDRTRLDERLRVDMEKEIIAKSLEPIFADVIFLSAQNELMQLLETDDPRAKELIRREYLEFSRQERIYDQIRFIDEEGMEICRIDFNAGKPAIVPDADLQSKKNRYYFNETLALNRGEIYVSPFDLNIENGEIERPFKPMIRFGTPVYSPSGDKRGVIIVNYLGSHLLSSIRELGKLSLGEAMLVNSEGYWLTSENTENQWGFMFEDRKDRTFEKDYPDEWRRISSSDSTQERSDLGLFTSRTIFLLSERMRASTDPGEAQARRGRLGGREEYYWKLISVIPEDQLLASSRGLLTRLFWLGGMLFLLSAIPAFLIAQAVVRRKIQQDELNHSAHFDELTGVPNRALFFDRLNQVFNQASRYERKFGLLFIDLDGFKRVNDTLGHDAGDEVLTKTADRLIRCVRKADTVARIGGDEFGAILTDINGPTDAEIVARRILEELSTPFELEKDTRTIGTSIGISIFSDDGDDAEMLLKKADVAMYAAKAAGGNSYQFSV